MFPNSAVQRKLLKNLNILLNMNGLIAVCYLELFFFFCYNTNAFKQQTRRRFRGFAEGRSKLAAVGAVNMCCGEPEWRKMNE